jgi:hypothetical protein
MLRAVGSIVVIGLLTACTGGSPETVTQTDRVLETKTQTQTVTETVTATPATTGGGSGGSVELADTSVANGDVKACENVRLAATREVNSPSWNDILSDADFQAQNYDLQDQIDDLYWSFNDAKARTLLNETLEMCEALGI